MLARRRRSPLIFKPELQLWQVNVELERPLLRFRDEFSDNRILELQYEE